MKGSMAKERQERKAYLYTFTHCKRRDIDIARIGEYFKRNGYRITKDIKKADLVLCNTCAHIKELEEASIRKIGMLKQKKSRDARLVVCGCLPGINKPRLDTVFKGISFGPRSLDRLDEIISAKVPMKEIKEPNIPNLREYNIESLVDKFSLRFEFSMVFFSKILESIFKLMRRVSGARYYSINDQPGEISHFNKDVFWIRIAEGCLCECSYCVDRLAVGSLHSTPREEIIDRFKQGLDRGYKKFYLIGCDCGAYGRDIGLDFHALLKELFSFKGNYKITILDLNPLWLIRDFNRLKDLLKENQGKLDYINLPIQSGSERILKLMRREYTMKDVEEKFLKLKEDVPGLKIFTEIIVGFPQETEEDFRATLSVIKDLKFNGILFFRYSDRPQTPALAMPSKIPKIIKDMRFLRAWFFYKKYKGFNSER